MGDQTRIQLGGYLLWRGGLLIAGAGTLYSGLKWALAYWFLPTEIVTGVALIVTGAGLVLLSLWLERRQDDKRTP